MKKRKKLLFSVFFLVLSLVLIEGSIRALGLAPPARKQFIEFFNNPCDVRRTSKIFRFDEHTFWEPVPGEYKQLWMKAGFFINSNGLRGGEVAPKKAEGVYRLLGVGDSSTFGVGVSFEDTFLGKLRACLSGEFTDKSFDVINGGVPGYSSFQGRRRFETKLSSFRPDLTTLYFGYNDLMLARRFTDQEATEWSQSISGKAALAVEQFALYRTIHNLCFPRKRMGEVSRRKLDEVREVIKSEGKFETSDKSRVPVEDYMENLCAMIDFSREIKCRPVLLGYAFSEDFHKHFPACERYLTAFREVAEKKKVEHLDLDRIFRETGESLLFGDGFHPNAKGHALIAQKIFEILQKTGLD